MISSEKNNAGPTSFAEVEIASQRARGPTSPKCSRCLCAFSIMTIAPSIIAPMVLDQRANPVLFDRDTLPDLMKLEGDVGGRGIFSRYKVTYLPWHDDAMLLDVDTPEHYQRLKDLLE